MGIGAKAAGIARGVVMRIMLVTWLLVAGFCGVVRAEIYEIPLPVTGTYALGERRTFEVELGTEFSEIREARLRVEGTMVAPLRDRFPYTPVHSLFFAVLDHPSQLISAQGPLAGPDTYPAPELFAGEDVFAAANPIDWTFFLDGTVSGRVAMGHSLIVGSEVDGGTGVITSASLILDATPVPEPGLFSIGAVALLTSSRRPRRVAAACSQRR